MWLFINFFKIMIKHRLIRFSRCFKNVAKISYTYIHTIPLLQTQICYTNGTSLSNNYFILKYYYFINTTKNNLHNIMCITCVLKFRNALSLDFFDYCQLHGDLQMFS